MEKEQEGESKTLRDYLRLIITGFLHPSIILFCLVGLAILGVSSVWVAFEKSTGIGIRHLSAFLLPLAAFVYLCQKQIGIEPDVDKIMNKKWTYIKSVVFVSFFVVGFIFGFLFEYKSREVILTFISSLMFFLLLFAYLRFQDELVLELSYGSVLGFLSYMIFVFEEAGFGFH